jgi:hypothetical protein
MAKRYQNLIEEYCALHSVAVPPGFGRQDAIQLTEGTRNTAHPQAAFVASGFAAGVDCLGLLFFSDARRAMRSGWMRRDQNSTISR